MAGKYRGVLAAEKYAELEARGESRPLCKCHGVEMQWSSSTYKLKGGQWSCKVKLGEARRRHNDRNPDAVREASRRYRHKHPERVSDVQRKYREANRDSIRERQARNKVRQILASEKYAELEMMGVPRPKCGCHNEDMFWHTDTTLSGGRWRCRVKEADRSRQYRADHLDEIRPYQREWRRKMRETDPEFAERDREARKRYENSVRGQEIRRKYAGSAANVDCQVRHNQKRRMRKLAERRKRMLDNDL